MAAKKARLAIYGQACLPFPPPLGPVRRSRRIAAQRVRLAEAQRTKGQGVPSEQRHPDFSGALETAKEARRLITKQRRERKVTQRLVFRKIQGNHGYDGEHEAYKRFKELFGDDWTYENWTSKVRLRAGLPAMTQSEIGKADFTFKDTKGRMRCFLETQGVTRGIWHDGTTFHLEVKSHLHSRNAGPRGTNRSLSSNQKAMVRLPPRTRRRFMSD